MGPGWSHRLIIQGSHTFKLITLQIDSIHFPDMINIFQQLFYRCNKHCAVTLHLNEAPNNESEGDQI